MSQEQFLQEILKRDKLIYNLLKYVNPVAFQIFCINRDMSVDDLLQRFVSGDPHPYEIKRIGMMSKNLIEACEEK